MIKLLLSCAPVIAIALQVHSMVVPDTNAIAVSQPPSVPNLSESPAKLADVIYAKINPRVVKIEAGQEIGSGAIVKGNLVTTCLHVVKRGGEIKVRMSDKQTTYAATVLTKDENRDLAVLKIADAPELPAIDLGSGVANGDGVFAFGSPLGLQGAMTEGKVLEVKDKYGNILMDARIKPGNSGGPLINKEGKIVGTNCAILGRDPLTGIAKPVDQMKELLGGAS